jgi:YtkA-like
MSQAFRRRFKTFGVAVLCAGLFFGGCQSRPEPQSDIVIEHEIIPDPPTVGRSTVTLRVKDASGRPLSGARVDIEANMSHAGMRPVFSEAKESAPGLYWSDFEFTMGGDWVVTVRLTLPDGRKVEREFDVKGVKSG